MAEFTEEQLMNLWYEQEMRERLLTEPGMLGYLPEDFEVNEARVIADECDSVASPMEVGML
jgi:hypothetical protein